MWFLLKAVLKAPARFPGGEACRVRWVLPTISTSNGLHFHDGRDPFWDWLLTPVGNTIATWYSVPSTPRTKCAHNVRHNHKLYISTVAREMRFPPLLLTNGGAFCFDTFPTLDVCLGGQRSPETLARYASRRSPAHQRASRAPHPRSRQRPLLSPPFRLLCLVDLAFCHSAEPLPVSAHVGSSNNLKDTKAFGQPGRCACPFSPGHVARFGQDCHLR